MPTHPWITQNLPDLSGTLAVITGANSGIGFETTKALAGNGAQVVMAIRSLERGQAAAERIRSQHPQARLEIMLLDLADLDSVHRFADEFLERYTSLPVLINNAGLMGVSHRLTQDGFEMLFGVNHLGHFALTGLLLPLILAAPAGRVVTLSSMMHLVARRGFDGLDGARRQDFDGTYSQSKLANLLFAYELQRRLEQTGSKAISLACHPGYAATNLQLAGARQSGSKVMEVAWTVLNHTMAQSAVMGALPVLYAVTSPDVNGGDYIAPHLLFGWRGTPTKARSSRLSYDPTLATRLWELSEEWTGVKYNLR